MVNNLEISRDTERSSDLNRGDNSDESIKSSYSCETCNQSFNSKLELKKHTSSNQH